MHKINNQRSSTANAILTHTIVLLFSFSQKRYRSYFCLCMREGQLRLCELYWLIQFMLGNFVGKLYPYAINYDNSFVFGSRGFDIKFGAAR